MHSSCYVSCHDDGRQTYKVARDVPGGKRILIMKINALHIAFIKAIKTRFKMENIYYVTFCFSLRYLQTRG